MPTNPKKRSMIGAPIDPRLNQMFNEDIKKNFTSAGYRFGEGIGMAEFLRGIACEVIAIYSDVTPEQAIGLGPDMSKAVTLGPTILRKLMSDWDRKQLNAKYAPNDVLPARFRGV